MLTMLQSARTVVGKRGALREIRNYGRVQLDGDPKSKTSKINVRQLLKVMCDLDAIPAERGNAFAKFMSAGNDPEQREHVISELREGLKHGDWGAAFMLGHLKATETLDDLGKAAIDDRKSRFQLRTSAINALGMMGKEAEGKVRVLQVALRNYRTGDCAAEALASIGEKGVHALTAMFKVPAVPVWTRVLAAETLGSMGGKAASALPELEKRIGLLQERNSEVRQAAREAAEKIRRNM